MKRLWKRFNCQTYNIKITHWTLSRKKMEKTKITPEIIVHQLQQQLLFILVKVRSIRNSMIAILVLGGSERQHQQPTRQPITLGCSFIAPTIIMKISHTKIINFLLPLPLLSTLIWIKTREGDIIPRKAIIMVDTLLHHLIPTIMVTICHPHFLTMITITTIKNTRWDTGIPNILLLCTINILSMEE